MSDETFTLASLRKSLGVSQGAMAEKLGCKQPEVSRIEMRAPYRLRLSTLTRYVDALGGSLEIMVKLGDEEFVVDPSAWGGEGKL